MSTLFILGVTSFLLCMLLTPLCTHLAQRFRLLDEPDSDRKFHVRSVPRIGGVPIVLSYALALALVHYFAPSDARLYIRHEALLRSLLPATGIVFLTGLLDDLVGLKPWQKLLGQLAGAVLAVSMGTRIIVHFSHATAAHTFVTSAWFSIPISVIWLIGCTNAVNLIDGLDGLAAGVGLFATVSTLLAAIITGHPGLLLATLPLAGCLLAFLVFNFNPASIFLGDSGSLTVGFILGCFGLIWSNADGTILGMAAPLMAFALPLLDATLAICRRYLRHVPIFKGDRGHVHHMVLARGFKTREATLILYGVCAVSASLGLLQTISRARLHGLAIGAFIVLVWAAIRYLDYVEFSAVLRFFSRRRVTHHVRDEIFSRELRSSMREATTPTGCWIVVRKVVTDMHFATVEMLLDDQHFFASLHNSTDGPNWKMTLPLGNKAYLTLSRISQEPAPEGMMSAIERLQLELTKKENAMLDLIHLKDVA